MRPRPGLNCLLLLSLAVAGRSQQEVLANSTLSQEERLHSTFRDEASLHSTFSDEVSPDPTLSDEDSPDPTLSEDVPEGTKDMPDLETRVIPSPTSPVYSLEAEVARSEVALEEASRSLEEAELEATVTQGRLERWEARYSHGLNVFVSWMMANSLCYDERINNTDINQLWRHSRSLSQALEFSSKHFIDDLLL